MPIGLYAIPDRGVNIALERRLGIFNPDATLSLMPELAATMQIRAEEMRYHLGWRRYAVTTVVAAVAAQFARVRLNVPTSALVIVQPDYVMMSASANFEVGATFTFGGAANLATVIGGAGGSGINRDGRQSSTTQATGGNAVVSKTTDAAAQVPTIYDGLALANTQIEFPFQRGDDYYLLPGNAMDFFFVAPANQAALITLAWQERTLNDQENSA